MSGSLRIKRFKRFVMPPPRPEDRPVITIELEEAATIDPKAWVELMEDNKHGGARPGAGRKALDDAKPTTKYLIAMTAAQRKKIEANGGAPWVRGLIDAAPDTTKIKPDPEGLKGREIEGVKSAKAVAKRIKAITPKKP